MGCILMIGWLGGFGRLGVIMAVYLMIVGELARVWKGDM